MTDKRRTPQQDLSADLHDFFNRVAGHNKEGIQTVLCVVVSADSQAYSFGAGNPDVLAQAVVRTIDVLAEKTPDFNEALQKALLAKRLQGGIGQMLKQVDEAKGMEAVKPEADALIAKLKGNPGAVPGPDTKR